MPFLIWWIHVCPLILGCSQFWLFEKIQIHLGTFFWWRPAPKKRRHVATLWKPVWTNSWNYFFLGGGRKKKTLTAQVGKPSNPWKMGYKWLKFDSFDLCQFCLGPHDDYEWKLSAASADLNLWIGPQFWRNAISPRYRISLLYTAIKRLAATIFYVDLLG